MGSRPSQTGRQETTNQGYSPGDNRRPYYMERLPIGFAHEAPYQSETLRRCMLAYGPMAIQYEGASSRDPSAPYDGAKLGGIPV